MIRQQAKPGWGAGCKILFNKKCRLVKQAAFLCGKPCAVSIAFVSTSEPAIRSKSSRQRTNARLRSGLYTSIRQPLGGRLWLGFYWHRLRKQKINATYCRTLIQSTVKMAPGKRVINFKQF